uniref:Protein Wnt n=1 Tax=Echeneis naucrates TaxID=173247 RepID=A0A665V7C3_ECHNA
FGLWLLMSAATLVVKFRILSCDSEIVVSPNRLAGKQAELCQTQPEIVSEVAKGARLGVRECQYQFRYRRWNCTTPLVSLVSFVSDIRETAFVYAITAAGVTHAVTQACSMGDLLQCGCEATRNRWEWGGCGDDVEFGYEKSKQFMDAKRRRGKSDIRTLIDLHNNEAGRLAVKLYMRTECKCHGLSGSCTLRTCWKKMPHFREVGDRLLERFNGASKVMGGNDGKTLIPGSLGTRGRMCNSTAMDISGCDLLCCERGYREETVVFEENCLCRFHWCCVVQCKKCLVRKELSLCH